MNGPIRPAPNHARPAVAAMHPAAGPSLHIGDIYYILFRHKWKILLCALAGFAAAAGFSLLNPPPFISEAKLFVRFVISERSGFGPAETNAKSPDQRGETIMNSELQILTSSDLATRVAQAVGPERILARDGGGNDLGAAAGMIYGGLEVSNPPRSSVIALTFKHPDREVVQPVLRELINQYLTMHTSIHRTSGLVGNFLSQETDQLRARLAQTEEQLRRANAKAGVISLENAKAVFAQENARLRQEIFQAQAELASKKAALERVVGNTSTAQEPDPNSILPRAIVTDYYAIGERIKFFQAREQQLLTQFTSDSIPVQEARTQMQALEESRQRLVDEHPSLAQLRASPSPAFGSGNRGDIELEAAQLIALETKLQVLAAQTEQLRREAAAVDQMEVEILELRRRKELEEDAYRRYAAGLEESRINEALGSGKISNISPIQTPSAPYVDNRKTRKTVTMLALGGIALGLGWALLIEFYIDRTVRRSTDIERLGRYPLFISIPRLKAKQLAAKGSPATSLATANGNPGNRASNCPALQPFHETLRDRMIAFFEAKGLTHKPKLVAITSIGARTGATTTAAGLARSLSETGDGNVLLVDMTPGQQTAHQFYRGAPAVGLEETLALKNERVQVEDNLYIAGSANGSELTRTLPRQFNKLLPKLRASDFDYIIFDMPPVSQISITPRVVGLMDMTFMVVESEKTTKDALQRAGDMLTEAGATVGVILNKNRSYVPSRLDSEVLN